MSLTNDQITAQNFKDFYGQIRPYLNGNVPTFANTFNKSDLYSTDETLIGRWIDGKPLYQKVVTITTASSVTGDWQNGLDLSALDIEYFTVINSTTPHNGDPLLVDTYVQYKYNKTTKYFQYASENPWMKDHVIKCIIQYTKVNDTQMSITDGNEYSLDEQVVGKWIDNKPIYQKTVSCGTLATGISNLPHNIANIDTVIDFVGEAKRSDGYRFVFPILHSDETWNCYIHGVNATDIVFIIGTKATGTYALTDTYVTIRYTKI